jgi:aspartate beta-hydroxylase
MTQAQIAQIAQAAIQAQKSGDRDGAVRNYRAWIDLDPANPAALNSLGIMLTDQGALDEAQHLFRRAIVADATAPELWMNLAKAQRIAGDDDAELASLNGALAIDQRHFMARVRKAELHERRGETGLANLDWSGVVQMAEGQEAANPGLTPLLDHARAYLQERGAEFARAIERDIEQVRPGVDDDAGARFDKFLDTSTKGRKIYHNECAGTYYPFLPAEEFFSRRHFPWMEKLESQTEAIRAELAALLDAGGDGFSPYVEGHTPK